MSSPADTPDPDRALTSSPALQGERVSFTGILASMTHQQAHELVAEQGGAATHHVSRQTTMLVVGEEGWPLEPDGEPSVKLQQVLQWQQEGLPIRVVRESEWLRLLGLEERRRDVQSLYTPAMLSKSLNVPLGTIRRWERLGLIRPVRKVYRLPYFDYAEAAGLRRLTQLLEAGISRTRLESSLSKLRTVLPDLDRPLAQLNLLADNTRLLVRDEHGPIEPTTGQRCLDFFQETPVSTGGELDAADVAPLDAMSSGPGAGPPSLASVRLSRADNGAADRRSSWSGEQWFAEGCRLLDAHQAADAVEAFRLSLMERPGVPEVHFHLAEALVRLGRREAALERYYVAVEADPHYLEAWTQIGCVHAEGDELLSALEAFQIALAAHAEYPDAHWHAADVLAQLGRGDEAAAHWRAYLEFDSQGPWADEARQRLQAIERLEPGSLEDERGA
jgi:tetratricopeptide (TPR) repeat protein